MEDQIQENAEWKKIQEKTFTRWCNQQLKLREVVIEELGKDLCDGVNLVILLEILTGKKLGRYNKKPRIHAQRMENVELCLNYITNKDKIRLVNIGSGDIVGGNIKLILGLVWMLILHYQISVGFGIGDQKGKGKHTTPKQALLGYVQHKIPHKDIRNFTGDWNDGTAVAALVESIAPGLCPDADLMEPKDALKNATNAMKLAEEWLGVPMVLQPEEMINPHVDELSMMTYVSQFPDAKLKPGAPLKPKGNPTKVKVTGPGVEEDGMTMGIPVMFYVDTKEAGVGNLDTHISSGQEEDVEVRVEDKKDGTYVCSYVPPSIGPMDVNVLWNNRHVKNSPFKVNVLPATNPLACRAYGPGVEGGDLKEDSRVEFTVETSGAGPGELDIAIRGPKGSLDCDVNQEGTDKYNISYTPPAPGQYKVEVTYNSLQIKDSPFKVHVEPDRPDASKCHAEGPGIQETLIIGDETWFKVHTDGAGKGDLVTNIRSPHGEVPINAEKAGKVTMYTYTPKETGELVITVKYGDKHIPGSRFRVQVDSPPDSSKCVTSGPGLSPKGVRVGEPAHFKVKTRDAGKGEVAVIVRSPGGEVPVNSSSSSSYEHDFVYVPSEAGMHQVQVDFARNPVPGSVFLVAVTDSSKVTIDGPGINGELQPAGVPLKYIVNAKDAGPGELSCHVQTPANQEEIDTAEDNPSIKKTDENGIYEILYTPKDAGLQKMKVSFNDSPIPKTPFRLNVYDASKVVATGPGLEDGNKTGELTHFTVDLKKAGDGNLHVHVSGPSKVPLVLKDQPNEVIHAEYTADVPGSYNISIQLEEEDIPGSPFPVLIKPKTDPSAVKAYGPGIQSLDLTTGMLADFEVDFSNGGEGNVQVNIQGPAGGVEYTEETVGDGIMKYTYLTDRDESGFYDVDIRFADIPIPGSSFRVPVKWKSDPSRVVAEGAGLQGGTTKEWTEFNLDLRKAGEGGINVSIEGPNEVEVEHEDHKDGTMTVKYFPKDPGEYKIAITFNGENIPGSIFRPFFDPCTDATKCSAFGPGLREDGVKVGDLGDFVIDTSTGGKGAVDVIINGPIGSPSSNRRGSTLLAKPIITNNQNGMYSVAYNPRRVGIYNIKIVFGDEEIPNSPYLVNVTDPAKIILSGPGCEETGRKGYHVNQPLEWTADCTQAGPGQLEASISFKLGNREDDEIVTQAIPLSKTGKEGVHNLSYTPEHPLMYQLNMLYSQNALDDLPVVSVLDTSKVNVFGPALDGVNVNDLAEFSIDTSQAGVGDLSLELIGSSPGNIEREKNDSEPVDSFTFVPTEAGEYQLHVKYGDQALPSSPFVIPVRDITKLDIKGSGITGENARVGSPADIVIDTNNSGPADLVVMVTDPLGNTSPVSLEPSSNDDKIFCGTYHPSMPGDYEVVVSFNKEDIPKSVPIGQPENVKLEGEGLEHAFVGQDNVIDCFTENAGPGEITAEFDKPSSGTISHEVTKVDDNHYQVHYLVSEPGQFTASIQFNNFPVKEAPRSILAVDLDGCKISGPGIEPGNLANTQTYFVVDTSKAGKGRLEVFIQDSTEKEVECEVSELEEGSYEVKYTPTHAGNQTIIILYEGKDLKQSPITVCVGDPDKVACSGPGLSQAIVNEPANFDIDISQAGEGSLNLHVSGPEEVAKMECSVSDESDTLYNAMYVARKPGLYHVHVSFGGVAVPGSPFQVECQRPPPDASKCKAIDIDTPFKFKVDCSEGGGTGLLEVGVCGSYVPADMISVHHNGDYTFNVSYDISEPGMTTISVKWHGKHLTGSPFTVRIE